MWRGADSTPGAGGGLANGRGAEVLIGGTEDGGRGEEKVGGVKD